MHRIYLKIGLLFCVHNGRFKFAYPLLQVSLRTATCTTTPPPKNGFFDLFCQTISKRNKQENDFFFYLENHSLSCETCVENGEASRCCHNLHYVPPWKSVARLHAMSMLVPRRQQETYAKEVFGVLRSSSNFYFPGKLVDAVFERERSPFDAQAIRGPVWVGIDPAGHSVSDFGLCAVAYNQVGLGVIVGASTVSVSRADVSSVLALIKVFLRRLRRLVPPPVPLCPIVECNLSEVYASSITKVFHEYGPIYFPFDEDTRFRSCVAPGVGVRTTHEIKMQMTQITYQHLLEGRLTVAEHIAHCNRADINTKSLPVLPSFHLEDLSAQLKRMADDEKTGEITGKNDAGDNDDLCIALMLALYWSLAVKAVDPSCQ